MAVRPGETERWERRLRISTVAADFEKDDSHHSRYEPTSYAVLARLAESGLIGRDDTLVDYGCGKGRVGFFLNHLTGCRAVGVEYNPLLFEQAQANLAGYAGKGSGAGVSFVCESAENYAVGGANRFYFFNPFSAKLLQAVLGRILEAYYEDPRELLLFFYYALDDTLTLLNTRSDMNFAGEIDCRDLFHNPDSREKILVYRLQPDA